MACFTTTLAESYTHCSPLSQLTASSSPTLSPNPSKAQTSLLPKSHISHYQSNDTTFFANAYDAIRPTCFSQPLNPSEPQLHTIIIDDCFETLFDILRSRTALAPDAWDPRFKPFPVWNVFGTCAIGIVPRFPTSRDVFPELLVAHVAAVVIDMCVKEMAGEKVGGLARIGVRNEFEVCVYGRDPGATGVLQTPELNVTASV
ncbi:hypothetical protein ACLMJK_005614 [Lecanora helva]